MVQSTHTDRIRNATNRGMNDNPKNIFEELTRKPADFEPDELDTPENIYEAMIESRGKKNARFHIITAGGHIIGAGYAYLLGWHYTPPDTLAIYTTTHQFLLRGEGMDIIERALLREKVLQLREYNPEKDSLASGHADKPKPMIRKIKILSAFDKSKKSDLEADTGTV